MSVNDLFDCQTIAPYLSAYADGELGEPLRSQVGAHVAGCDRCAAEISRIRSIDQIIGGMAHTKPTAGVFERTLAAATRQASGQPRLLTREALPGMGAANVRRRLRTMLTPELDGGEDAPSLLRGIPMRIPARARWVAAAIPALAALLLISLALSLFSHPSTSRSGSTSVAKTTGVNPLQQTRTQMASLVGQLAFTPLSPSYLPDGAGAPDIRVGPDQVDANSRYVDVTWTFVNGPAQSLHLRELPSGLNFYGYAPVNASAQTLAWSLPQHSGWRQLSDTSCKTCLAVGEAHAGMQMALDVKPRGGAASLATAEAWLRLVSLSLDAPYQPLSVTVTGPSNTLAMRYQAVVTGASGAQWNWTGVIANGSSRQQSATVTSGGVDITEVVNGSQGVRLNNATHTYQPLNAPPASIQPPQRVTQPLYSADAYLAYGELWNLGASHVTLADGIATDAYVLYWVDAARPEILYVDASTGQALELFVSAPSTESPGGAQGVQDYISTSACPPYTVTYTSILFAPLSALNASFDTTRQPGWVTGVVTPAFSCNG